MKNTANWRSLNRVNAFSPKDSASDWPFSPCLTGTSGMVRAYAHRTRDRRPEETSCVQESCIATESIFMKLVQSMLMMKPTVPNTRIGGKSFTGSFPASSRAL